MHESHKLEVSQRMPDYTARRAVRLAENLRALACSWWPSLCSAFSIETMSVLVPMIAPAASAVAGVWSRCRQGLVVFIAAITMTIQGPATAPL